MATRARRMPEVPEADTYFTHSSAHGPCMRQSRESKVKHTLAGIPLRKAPAQMEAAATVGTDHRGFHLSENLQDSVDTGNP